MCIGFGEESGAGDHQDAEWMEPKEDRRAGFIVEGLVTCESCPSSRVGKWKVWGRLSPKAWLGSREERQVLAGMEGEGLLCF